MSRVLQPVSGQAQVGDGLAAPPRGVGGGVVIQMPHGNGGADGGVVAFVEGNEAARGIVAAPLAVRGDQRRADPRSPKAAALQAQEGKLGEGIEQAERAVELETVDHQGRGGEADVLRPQVAVGIDDTRGTGLQVSDVCAEPAELSLGD